LPPTGPCLRLLAVKLQQDFQVLDFTAATTDTDLVVDYLGPAIRRMPKRAIRRLCVDPTRRYGDVNADLPSLDPWKLPGIAGNSGKKDKYYLTDHLKLNFFTSNFEIRTPNGVWKTNMMSMIRGGGNEFVGIKKTIKFHPNTGDGALSGTKTNWIMHVYYCLKSNVITEDSTDTNGSRKCPTLGSHPGVCNGNHCYKDSELQAMLHSIQPLAQ